MSTDTVRAISRPINPSKMVTVKERLAYLRRFRALGWTQNEAARQIGKEPSLFSRWLRGLLASAPMRRAIDARLAEAAAELVEAAS
jgi:ParB-like chromosome segregation protein Spo0J